MGYVYTGRQTVNNTFRLDGHSPLDRRTVLGSISDVYINHNNPNACELFLNAYAGMLISTFDENGNVILISLKDHTPYTQDNKTITKIDVTAENFEDYWNVIGQFTEDKIQNIIDPSINKIEDYVGSDDNITNTGNAGGITVTPSKDADSVGYSYGLAINVDDDTIKLVNNALAVGQYKIEKADTASDGFLASYKLKYKAPGSSSWVDVSGGNLIDIPKDFVLKSVHICKASYDSASGEYTESSTPADAGWAADTNDVYFHFEWMTVDSETTTTETFLKVADVIAADIVSINTSIVKLEASVGILKSNIDASYVEINNHIDASLNTLVSNMNTSFGDMQSRINASYDTLSTHINASYVEVNNHINASYNAVNQHIDASYVAVTNKMDASHNAMVASINASHNAMVESINASYIEVNQHIDASIDSLDNKINSLTLDVSANLKFDGGDMPDTNAMITKHGNLSIKTVAQLEEMTLSEIIKAILFEVAVPTKTVNEALTVSWNTNSAFKNTVDVGHPFPVANTDFNYTYTSETWNWKASDGVTVGSPKTLSKVESGNFVWKHSTTNNTSGTISTDWSGKTAEFGTNGYFFVTVNRTANQYAVDSQGRTKNDNGVYYKEPVSGEKNTTGTFLSFTASTKMYTNANNIKTDVTSAWSARNTSPGAYKGANDKSTVSGFLTTTTTNTTLYLQWPQIIDKSGNPCYLYVPTTHSVVSCKGANPTATNTFDVTGFTVTEVGTDTINNSYQDVSYKKYAIGWEGDKGILTLQVVIKKV